MSDQTRELLLKLYAKGVSNPPRRDLFLPILLMMILLFGGTGWYLKVNNPPPETFEEKMSRMQTSFIIEEKTVVKQEKNKPKKPDVKKEIPEKKKPIDLTEKPLLDQKLDDIIKEKPAESPKVVRRVYGLKKVYSTGIGVSGDAANAVIGKLGNTLNTEIDTFTATQEELKGTLVSIVTVTKQPKLKVNAKPEYTKEMLENRVEGSVRVKVLIDIDGKVKKAIVLDDLGYGMKEKAYEACMKLLFEPAYVGEEPVSSWITIRFTFRMQN